MTRKMGFWAVVIFAGALLLGALGIVVSYLLDMEGGFGLLEDVDDDVVAYLTTFGLVFADAIVPIFPGETTLNTASVLASQGELELGLVMLAGALGAILGDSTLYWVARTGPQRLKARLETASQDNERMAKGLALLGRSGPLLIACGRFVPGVRFVVNVTMGMTEYPYPKFLLWSAIGGSAWAIYTCARAYRVSTALADFPLASIVISGIVTTILIAGVYWLDRRRPGDEPTPAEPGVTP